VIYLKINITAKFSHKLGGPHFAHPCSRHILTTDGNASQYSILLSGPVMKANRSALPSPNTAMQIINPLNHNGNYENNLLPSLK
jgi:hypothetical protein